MGDRGDPRRRAREPRAGDQRPLADQTRPGSSDRPWRSLGGLHHRRPSLPAKPLPLPIPAGSVGVPAVEDGRLLVDIRDVGTHLREAVEGVNHPDVAWWRGWIASVRWTTWPSPPSPSIRAGVMGGRIT